jgi:hypothetical protein
MSKKQYERAYAPAWEAIKKNLVIDIDCEERYYTTIKEMISLEKHLDRDFRGDKRQKRLHFVKRTRTIDGEVHTIGMTIRLVDRKKLRLDDL